MRFKNKSYLATKTDLSNDRTNCAVNVLKRVYKESVDKMPKCLQRASSLHLHTADRVTKLANALAQGDVDLPVYWGTGSNKGCVVF